MIKLFDEYEDKIPEVILDRVKIQSKKQKLDRSQLKKVLEIISEKYVNALIQPGESIGLVTAESFGEPGTQMVLRTFHFAGVTEMQVTEGLPRLIEIFDARVNPKTPSMEVYLEGKYTKDEKVAKKVASKIKEVSLGEVSKEFSINLMKKCIEVGLNYKKMKEYGLKFDVILAALIKAFKTIEIKENKKGITMTPKEVESIVDLYKLKEKSKEVIIRGLKGITQVVPVKRDGELIIMTAGSNLKGVLEFEEINKKKTFTNCLLEIEKLLGIEAARQAIINESSNVIKKQGLNIDIRHIMFLADLMTNNGSVKGITRGGITGAKESVLARASFEIPLTHLVNASLVGETDSLNSVIENVMLNQPVPLGTGLPGVVTKVRKELMK